jgi:gluconate 2-dehydrogenase gamma chain
MQLFDARHAAQPPTNSPPGEHNMTSDTSFDGKDLGRRGFLRQVVTTTGAASVAPSLMFAATSGAAMAAAAPPESATGLNTPATSAPDSAYLCFGPDEAALMETLVDTMCPADGLTPSGTDCGLARFIDRQLAGGYGKGEKLYMRGPWRQGKPQQGYQLPLTPEQFFKVGLAATDAAYRTKHGKSFGELQPPEADAFLHDIAGGKVTDAQIPLASWFNELVYPLFVQACFADPIYGGNVGKVFWKLVGYPGLPATHAQDMIEFRGKLYPGAKDPKSIADFS